MKNASLESIKQMKLLGMASAYEAILSMPINQQPDAHELLARLLDAEQQYRSVKRMNRYLKLSKLRYQVTPQDIDCSEQRNLSKEKLMLLADCSYLGHPQKIVERLK